jgi:hypothetical protein
MYIVKRSRQLGALELGNTKVLVGVGLLAYAAYAMFFSSKSKR